MIYVLTVYLILLAIDRIIMVRRLNALQFALHLLMRELRSQDILDKESIEDMARTFEREFPNDTKVSFR